MLNYIWLTLLALGIGTALTLDLIDLSNNKYNNGKPLIVISNFENSDRSFSINANIFIDSITFNKFYKTSLKHNINQKVKLTFNKKENYYSVYFLIDENTPEIWKETAKASGKENDLTGKLILINQIDSLHYTASLILEEVSFVKMKEVTNAIIDYASTAVKIALGLIGIMALWLGVMKIAEQSGLVKIIANSVRPITRFLFPDVPQDHPAIGSIIMNISANMLGLGNAATPFGLKAMEELDKLNPNKGTATNAMCTFLAINTAGLTLIPATAIAVRAASGSSEPTIIIGTSFFGASCATIMGIIAAKIFEKFPLKSSEFVLLLKKNLRTMAISLLTLTLIFTLFITKTLTNIISLVNAEAVKNIIQIISVLTIPLIIIFFVLFGIIKKVKIYEVFIEGAKEGFNVAVRIIPYLVAMLIAIGIFRAGGAMEFLIKILSPATDLIGFPAEALPMALMRPLSGSGSLGIMSEIISVHGADSFIGILVSTIMGSTETTFYVLALYFGSVNIKRTRHAAAAGIMADIAGILGALFIVKLLFG